MTENIKETVQDIVRLLAPIDGDENDEYDNDHFTTSFKLAVDAARKWRDGHGGNVRASISVQWDENGKPMVTITPIGESEDEQNH